jgi:hypothetical protein
MGVSGGWGLRASGQRFVPRCLLVLCAAVPIFTSNMATSCGRRFDASTRGPPGGLMQIGLDLWSTTRLS